MSKKSDILAESIAKLDSDAQNALSQVVNLLTSRPRAKEDEEKPNMPGRRARTVNAEADEEPKRGRGRPPKAERRERDAEPTKRGRGRPPKVAPKETRAQRTPARRNITLAAPVGIPVTAADFCEKYGVVAKSQRKAYEQISAILADNKLSDVYWKRATKAGIEVKMGRGKPSEGSRKRAAVVALFNAGKL